MQILHYEFRLVGKIEPVLETDGSVRQFMPQIRYKNAGNLPVNKYGNGPFCKFSITNILRNSGVYILCVEESIKYVGECVNLSALNHPLIFSSVIPT